MLKYNIPTADAREFDNSAEFEEYIKKSSGKIVIKKSGLAAGKGVLESDDKEELLAFGLDILKDDKLLIEEYLVGWETTIFTLSDGKDYVILLPAQILKRHMIMMKDLIQAEWDLSAQCLRLLQNFLIK